MMLLAFSQIKRYHPTLKYSPDDSNVANRISKVPDKSYKEMIKTTKQTPVPITEGYFGATLGWIKK